MPHILGPSDLDSSDETLDEDRRYQIRKGEAFSDFVEQMRSDRDALHSLHRRLLVRGLLLVLVFLFTLLSGANV